MKRNLNRIRAVRKEIGRMCRERRKLLGLSVRDVLTMMHRDESEQFSMYAFERGDTTLDWLVSYAIIDSAIPVLACAILLKHRKDVV